MLRLRVELRVEKDPLVGRRKDHSPSEPKFAHRCFFAQLRRRRQAPKAVW